MAHFLYIYRVLNKFNIMLENYSNSYSKIICIAFYLNNYQDKILHTITFKFMFY